MIKAGSDSNPVFDLVPPIENVYIHDLRIVREGAGTGTGSAIRCRTTAAGQRAASIRLRGVYVSGFAGHGIHLEGFNNTDARIDGLSAIACTVVGCKCAGLYMVNVLDAFLLESAFRDNQMNGLAAIGSGLALYGCEFEGNCLLSSWTPSLNPNEGNLKLDSCLYVSVDGCRIAKFHLGNIKKGCVLVDCGGGSVRLGNFSTEDATDTTGIVVTGAGSGPIVVMGNRFKNVEVLIDIDPAVRDCVLLPQYDEDASGTMNLPSSPNQGLFGSPQVNSGPPLSGLGVPLIVPSGDVQDYAALQPGTIFYDRLAEELRVYVPGALKGVVTET